MNSLGDIALGFSASNNTNPSLFPSVYYTGRHAGDPPGQIPSAKPRLLTGPVRKPGQRIAGGITLIRLSIQAMTRTSGMSMGKFPRPARTDGDCESARLIWPAVEARHQHQRPRRVQLLRRRRLLLPRAVNTRLRQAQVRSFRGTTDTGNHIDDGDTFISLPFSFSLYDQTYNGVNVNSNGRLDFVCINEPVGYQSACLPAPDNQCSYAYTIFPLWSDYRTDVIGEGCSTFASGCGIFTSVSGTAPNRIFNIEWRAVYFADHTQTANFEIRLYENSANKQFDFIFGIVQPGSDQLYVSGVQGPNNAFDTGLLQC